jgi:hypothetical protein
VAREQEILVYGIDQLQMGQAPGCPRSSSNNFVSFYFQNANDLVLKPPFNVLKDGQFCPFIDCFSKFPGQSAGNFCKNSSKAKNESRSCPRNYDDQCDTLGKAKWKVGPKCT